jgi:hypothetical protein
VHATLRLAQLRFGVDDGARELASPTYALPFLRIGDKCATRRTWLAQLALSHCDLDVHIYRSIYLSMSS